MKTSALQALHFCIFSILEWKYDHDGERDPHDDQNSATSFITSSLEDVEDLTKETPPQSKKGKGMCV